MSESDAQKAILDYLQYQKDSVVLRLNSGKVLTGVVGKQYMVTLCPEGTPDVFFMKNGVTTFFEVKASEKAKKQWHSRVDLFKKTSFPSDYHRREINQHKAHEKIRKAGGRVYVVCSLDEVIEIIKNL